MRRLPFSAFFFFFNDTATTEIYTLSLHDALPISETPDCRNAAARCDSASNIPRRLDVQSESILTSFKRLDSVGSQSTRCGGRYDLRVQWIEASLGASKRQARGGNATCRSARSAPDDR